MEFMKHKNLYYLESPHNIVSVFDASFYDRADLDCLNNSQRNFLCSHLLKHGFKQITGSKLYNEDYRISVIFPKIRSLGVSPFVTIESIQRKPGDILAFTPTQLACYILNHFPAEDYETQLKRLIEYQPINLRKLQDTLVHEVFFNDFMKTFEELLAYQKKVANSERFIDRKHIGSIF